MSSTSILDPVDHRVNDDWLCANPDRDVEQVMEKSPLAIDDILSEHLLKLSLRDRDAVNEEVHGVFRSAIKESPEFLEKSLLDLAGELIKIPESDKAAYIESQILPETYVNTPDFRLRFLRCELFDARKAAIRMVKFLELATFLFGPIVLERPMRYTDLTKDEVQLFRTGNVQVLPYRDQAGRLVFTWCGDFGYQQGTHRSRVKITFYLHWALSDDVLCQQEGVTAVLWAVSSNVALIKPDWDNNRVIEKLFEALPVRTSVTHWCVPDKPYFRMLRFLVSIALGTYRVVRMRTHIGEEVETKYTLKTFGIPTEFIPVTSSGKIKTTYHKQWIKARQHLEEVRANGNDASSIIFYPRPTDVIFRTGRSLTCHRGNAIFQSLIEPRMQEHLAASQHQKAIITKSVIQAIRRQGGRFLAWDTRGWWKELFDDSEIHLKVSCSLKNFKHKPVSRKQQMSRSSTSAFQNQDNAKRRKIPHDGEDGSSDRQCDCSCLF